MALTDRIQDGALGGSFGERVRLVEAGRRIADIIPSPQRDAIRDHSDSLTVDATTRWADVTEYTSESTPVGQAVSWAGDAADKVADSIGGLVGAIRDPLPSEGMAKAIAAFVAVLATVYVFGTLFNLNVGGNA